MANVHELGPMARIDPDADAKILNDLTETMIPLINRHSDPRGDPAERDAFPTLERYMSNKDNLWTPAMMIPWSVGENFPNDYQWAPEDSPLPEAAQSSLLVGLLTEDNLPEYAKTIDKMFGENEALNFWNGIWTAEEGRHSEVMRGYMTVGRIVDPMQLAADYMQQRITKDTPQPPTAIQGLVYVTFQELATRYAHLNTGKLIGGTALADSKLFPLTPDGTALANVEPAMVEAMDPEERTAYLRSIGRTIMTKVAADENKHFVLYRDGVGKGAMQIDPSTVVKATEREMRKFQMPGKGIRGFWDHARIIADAEVFDLRILRDGVFQSVLNNWDIENAEGLDDEAKEARERIMLYLENLDILAKLDEEGRDERRAANPDAEWVGQAAALASA